MALNFGDRDRSVPFCLPIAGNYQEKLNGENNFIGVPSYPEYWVTIPKNYGSIWTTNT
ncbi:MAG: hypothetical protein V7K90_28155 [Nostoc sp.]|uniref:hypothetical protein n=1 Tax=Nostoc sp. TaxID=1180 RepID=UPI002FFC17E6